MGVLASREIDLPSRQTGSGDEELRDRPLEVEDLAALVETRARRAHFRNEIVTGAGGKQILVVVPSGDRVDRSTPGLPEAAS